MEAKVKVITKSVISIKTLKVVEQESYEYEGPVAKCFGSGGQSAGGGGGGSGAITYPAHINTAHQQWLNHTGADTVNTSLTDIMNTSFGNSPWVGYSAYNPDADLIGMIAAPDTLQTLVTLLSTGTGLDTLISDILDHTRVDDAATEYAADLDARLTGEILPRFQAGMRNINAVVSSAFVIGRALIEENQDRLADKFNADIHLKSFGDDAIRVVGMKLEYQKQVAQMLAEIYRVRIVAKKEELETNIRIDESDALWDFEIYQYAANLLAAPGGGTVVPQVKQPNAERSMIGGAIGGAMTGAASGAMIGGPPGAAIGGLLGAASAFIR